MTGWTDAHNHLQDPRLGDPAVVIAAMKAAGVRRCVVNATCENDWPSVAALATAHPGFVFPTFGIHPWRADTAAEGWQDRLVDMLEKHPHASIGECGLDGWVASPSLEIQIPVFRDQLRLARERNLPVTIHCLKAWEALFASFAESPPPARFLMHSFGGSIEIARRLMPLGACFSFSGYFLSERKSAVLEVFRQLPPDRILLETDAPDMLPPESFITHRQSGNHNHPANLPAIGAALASALGIPPETLAERTNTNTELYLGIES
jgi:TatD DNase family protein